MNKISEMSLYPKFECISCSEKLWIVRGRLETRDGRKHLKTRCNLKGVPKNEHLQSKI